MTSQQYTDTITQLNDRLKPSRSTKIDTVLLGTGPLMVPLAVWAARHGVLTKKRKRLLKEFIEEFNGRHRNLYMRWNRRPDSVLTIEIRRGDEGNDVGGDGAVVVDDYGGRGTAVPSFDSAEVSNDWDGRRGTEDDGGVFMQVVPLGDQTAPRFV
eukprot:CAMPEP_0172492838 /NCGR_PEP_ID=MMETSP1066-20121228/24090_1 /TAXON_ID=671091 /ORGANISM="Coscinodiscus wailesii, Strain CCMP2513" /LENGTH=154 /DNA_ID=CAMNT_0013262659 /DNA_START=277 /DNA_END=741 /DNA_ORIENTATION=+